MVRFEQTECRPTQSSRDPISPSDESTQAGKVLPPIRRPAWMTNASVPIDTSRSAEVSAENERWTDDAAAFARQWLDECTDEEYLGLMASRPYLTIVLTANYFATRAMADGCLMDTPGRSGRVVADS